MRKLSHKQEPVIRAKDFPDFVVDRRHGSLINTNVQKLLAYKEERSKMRIMQDNSQRLDSLENDIRDIKIMLQQLVEQNGSK